MSLIPMFSMGDVFNRINKFVDEREKKIVMVLSKVGSEFCNHAKDSGDYINVTGNLRNSIGYTVLLNGDQKITKVDRVTKGAEGIQKGKECANEHAGDSQNQRGALKAIFPEQIA